jgi:flagella basal body P-ring formation protein FlgA
MNRLIALTAALLIAAPISALAEVRLRGDVTIDGENVTVGDLFKDAGRASEHVVAPAPAYGRTITYKSVHLKAIAKNHELDWQPAPGEDSVRVTRGNKFVSDRSLERLILPLLGPGLNADTIDISLAPRSTKVPAPADPNASVMIDDFNLDRQTGRFVARVLVPGDAGDYFVQGRALVIARVPVPVRTLARNALVEAADIEWREVRLPRLPVDLVVTEEDIVGKTVRRTLRAGSPVHTNELSAPILVEKGALVTISLQAPGLLLSGVGRALEDGAAGDPIRVVNTRSKRTIEAVVSGHDQVKVQLHRQLAAAAIR